VIVLVIAVCVGVAGPVEPVERHPLAEPRRRQQPVDDALVGAGPLVGEELLDLVPRRRQPRVD
jgi:hypothetical protein